MRKYASVLIPVGLIAAGTLMAEAYNPLVHMKVTEPGGQTNTITAPESGLATLTVAGIDYGFRPTIIDSKPWSHVVVTVFKMGTSRDYTRELGEVDLKTGGASVASKTDPSFRIGVTEVTPPEPLTPQAPTKRG